MDYLPDDGPEMNGPAPVGSSPDNPAPAPVDELESSDFLSGLQKAAETPDGEVAKDESTPTEQEEEQPEAPAQEEETDPDLADLPKSASAKTKDHWKKSKEAKRAVEAERDNLKKELEELRKQPQSAQNSAEIEAVKKELESYKEKLSGYESKMALLDVTQTEEYRNNIAQPLAAAESLIEAFSQKYEIPIATIAKAAMHENILERNAQLAELASGMNEFDKFEFKKTLDDARNLYIRSEQVKAQAKESLKYVEAKRQEEQAKALEQTKAARAESAKKVWDSLSKSLPESIRGDLDKLSKDALGSDLQDAPPEIQAYATQAAVLLPAIKEKYEAALKEIGELKASIAKRGGVAPKSKSGSIPTVQSEEPEDFMAGLEAAMKGV
jgi:hypothetical protein